MKLDDSSASPPYIQVADALRKAISTGELNVGDKLPSGPKLAKQLGVSTMTARRAIERLQRDGLLRSTHGVGVFVSATVPADKDDELAVLRRTVDELERRVAAVEQLLQPEGGTRS
ncbi:DNA-binding GntR family transcriptional regulator [Kribbella aluminosa]|uniref:DNA-binding GntR family transcriptional regulator n=1 Tax=Kribbella aluminosa TaxID=416017 RepID=A0ABS4USF8_9ACTN|nr:GntR family transcriptional regulator [Kribbella aluminosa]MBP2354583.1 DNA-binding GntR family transcriptional regulator [Kribbella aluminosa]